MKIIPTVFAKNKKEFKKRFKKVTGIAKDIQIDFMDGKFVNSKSIRIKDIPKLNNYNNDFEAHLMTKNPEKYVLELKKKGFKKVFFHYEAYDDSEKVKFLAHYIKVHGLTPGVVFNSNTDFEKTKEIMHFVNYIIFMGHTPGVEHKPFNENVIRKIRKLRRLSRKINIQVDGGVNDKTIGKLDNLGVDIVNVGSFISDAENPRKALKKLSKLV